MIISCAIIGYWIIIVFELAVCCCGICLLGLSVIDNLGFRRYFMSMIIPIKTNKWKFLFSMHLETLYASSH